MMYMNETTFSKTKQSWRTSTENGDSEAMERAKEW